jgi:hypothetical protein
MNQPRADHSAMHHCRLLNFAFVMDNWLRMGIRATALLGASKMAAQSNGMTQAIEQYCIRRATTWFPNKTILDTSESKSSMTKVFRTRFRIWIQIRFLANTQCSFPFTRSKMIIIPCHTMECAPVVPDDCKMTQHQNKLYMYWPRLLHSEWDLPRSLRLRYLTLSVVSWFLYRMPMIQSSSIWLSSGARPLIDIVFWPRA